MENYTEKGLVETGDDARRQYIDARAVFTAWEAAQKKAAEVRGGMYWKHQGKTDYLIRTSTKNTQKSLGPRSPETEAIFEKFISTKASAEGRVKQLGLELTKQQRLNRALFVGRAPKILVELLNTLNKAGIAEHFLVVGTHALFAYEAAAGVRFESGALATRDVDLLWDTRKRISLVTELKTLHTSLLGILRQVDPTFQLREEQRYTAVNQDGFEVDILRREAKEGDPHPLQLSDEPDDFWAVQARKAGQLLSGPVFSAMIVSASGHMARMRTIAPGTFVDFKRWMAEQPEREPFKGKRDRLQAELVARVVEEYLPQGEGPR